MEWTRVPLRASPAVGKGFLMIPSSRKTIAEGVGWGLLAGLLFAIVEMIGAAAMGASALSPWRAFASTVLGQRALEQTPPGTTFIVGVVAHFVLSAIYGLVYAFANRLVSDETRRSYGREAALGLLFGIALYVVNFQVIARLVYPWFRNAPQLWQFILHTVFFGLPLALFITASERSFALPRAAAAERT